MHKDKYVFAQLVEFLDRNHFNYIVRKYQGDRYIKSFSCWNQLLVMMFGQLAKSESLRDLIVALEAHWKKLYHLGMGKSVTRSNLAKANEQRNYKIFEEFAYRLVTEARSKCAETIFGFKGNVYAFESTTIDLCLELFHWAKFRKHKGGIKPEKLYNRIWENYLYYNSIKKSSFKIKITKSYNPEGPGDPTCVPLTIAYCCNQPYPQVFAKCNQVDPGWWPTRGVDLGYVAGIMESYGKTVTTLYNSQEIREYYGNQVCDINAVLITYTGATPPYHAIRAYRYDGSNSLWRKIFYTDYQNNFSHWMSVSAADMMFVVVN